MKRILAIDGGGIRGLIPAVVLCELERRLGKPTSDTFDLIAGTSTGGILALGLAVPGDGGKPLHSAEDLASLYRDHGREIFQRSFWRGMTSLGGLSEEKYPAGPLEGLLRRYLGDDTPLSAARVNVLVSSYDLERRRPFFFKSWRGDRSAVPMWHAARATSAAPTYFDPCVGDVGEWWRALVDGGVAVNNPAMSAYAEARRLWGPDEDLLVVSLGTGVHTRSIDPTEASDWGYAQWTLPILSILMDGSSDAADYQLRHILEDGQSYFRFQIPLEGASDDMDNASAGNIRQLELRGQAIIAERGKELEAVAARLARVD